MSLAQPFSNFEPEKRAIVPFCSFAASSSICLPPSHLYTMSESGTDRSMLIESDVDRIRRNGKSLIWVHIRDWESGAVEILDALKKNTVVKEFIFHIVYSVQLMQEALVKLSDVMKCNKSVTKLTIYLESGLLRERVFAAMATSGGWSSIQELVFFSIMEHMSLREAEHLSSFILQCENLRSLSLQVVGGEITPIVETLSRTKVQSLKIRYDVHSTLSLQNGGRRLATAFETCTCIAELQLNFPNVINEIESEFYQILLVESIPKMLGLKKLELAIDLSDQRVDQGFFDMVGQCIGGTKEKLKN